MAYLNIGQSYEDESPDDYVDVDFGTHEGARMRHKVFGGAKGQRWPSFQTGRTGATRSASRKVGLRKAFELDGLGQFALPGFLNNPLVAGGLGLAIGFFLFGKKKR